MQHIFLLSAYEITASAFFQKLKQERTDLVLDIRLNNTSQLCGFTKEKDLSFFVSQLTGAAYIHDLDFAPTKQLLDGYIKEHLPWNEYATAYLKLLNQRHGERLWEERYKKYGSVCLLGTETKKRRSHNEVLLDVLQNGF